MNKPSSMKWGAAIAAAGVSALLMYLFDPDKGRRRTALAGRPSDQAGPHRVRNGRCPDATWHIASPGPLRRRAVLCAMTRRISVSASVSDRGLTCGVASACHQSFGGVRMRNVDRFDFSEGATHCCATSVRSGRMGGGKSIRAARDRR